MSIEQMFLMQT
jgi:hypothetical protein